MGKYDNSIPMARSWEVYIFEKFSMSTLFYEAYRKKFIDFFLHLFFFTFYRRKNMGKKNEVVNIS